MNIAKAFFLAFFILSLPAFAFDAQQAKPSGVWREEGKQFASFKLPPESGIQKDDEFIVIRNGSAFGLLRVTHLAMLHAYGAFESAAIAYSNDDPDLKLSDIILLPEKSHAAIQAEGEEISSRYSSSAMAIYSYKSRGASYILLDRGLNNGIKLDKTGSLLRGGESAGAVSMLQVGQNRSIAVYQEKKEDVVPMFGDIIRFEEAAPKAKRETKQTMPKPEPARAEPAPEAPKPAKVEEKAPETPALLLKKEADKPAPPAIDLDSFFTYSNDKNAAAPVKGSKMTAARRAPENSEDRPARRSPKTVSFGGNPLLSPGIAFPPAGGAVSFDAVDYKQVFRRDLAAGPLFMSAESDSTALAFSLDNIDLRVGIHRFTIDARREWAVPTRTDQLSETIRGQSILARTTLGLPSNGRESGTGLNLGFQYFGGDDPDLFKGFVQAAAMQEDGEFWVGVSHISGGKDNGFGVEAGARFAPTESLEMQVDYSGRDMTKAILNNSAFLKIKNSSNPALAPELSNDEYCAFCDDDALNFSLRYKFSGKVGLEYSLYDITNFSASRLGAQLAF